MSNLDALRNSIIQGKTSAAKELTAYALKEGQDVKKILEEALISGMEVVGQRFKDCDIFLSEVLLASKAMKEAMDILRPSMVEKGLKFYGKVVIGTVKGDLHDIGKNLVSMMLQGAGFEVINLGVDVAPEEFIKAIEEHKPQVLGMSAMLTTTMPFMKETLEALRASDFSHEVKAIIGGAPITQAFAEEISAHGYSPDATSAVDKVKELLNLS